MRLPELRSQFRARKVSVTFTLTLKLARPHRVIVTDPVDDQTQVVTYIKGFMDGPIKTACLGNIPRQWRSYQSLLARGLRAQTGLRHSAAYRPQGTVSMEIQNPWTSPLLMVRRRTIQKRDRR